MSEQEKFEAWWKEKGFNSVVLRAAALTAWMARAEMDKEPQPAEDTDEWVVLDPMKYAGHVLRKNIDFTNTRTGWEPISIWGGDTIGGILKHYSDTLFRCRRRDLPQPQKTRVRLWIDPDCNVHAGLEGDRDLELHYDHETRQFYTEEPS